MLNRISLGAKVIYEREIYTVKELPEYYNDSGWVISITDGHFETLAPLIEIIMPEGLNDPFIKKGNVIPADKDALMYPGIDHVQRLNKCPFCGSSEQVVAGKEVGIIVESEKCDMLYFREKYERTFGYVRCKNCGASVIAPTEKAGNPALPIWNKRAKTKESKENN